MPTMSRDAVTKALAAMHLEFRDKVPDPILSDILLGHVLKLIAPTSQPDEDEASLLAAVRRHLKNGRDPGRTVPWKAFFRVLWSDLGVNADTRGYGEKTIRRAVDRARHEIQ